MQTDHPFLLRSQKAAAALCFIAAAQSSHAQSALTLFGGVDLGVRMVNNSAGTTKGMNSGNNYTSRWGLRAQEDLGGGHKASLWLESTINADTGSSNPQFFDRRSTVALSGDWGEVRMGRDYTPVFRGYGIAEVFDFAGLASMTTIYNGSASTVLSRAFKGKTSSNGRTNGSLQYFTPDSLGGFHLSAMLSHGGDGNVSGDHDYKGLRVGYSCGPWQTAAFAGSTEIRISGGNYRIRGGSAAYRLGTGKLTAGVVTMRYLDARQTNYTLGLIWPLGIHQVKATWHHIDQAGRNAAGASIDRNDADLMAIGYVHNLSKRTALYGTLAFIRNRGQASFSITGESMGARPGGNARGLELGLRHMF